jgi:hypothetical protein
MECHTVLFSDYKVFPRPMKMIYLFHKIMSFHSQWNEWHVHIHIGMFFYLKFFHDTTLW